MQRHFFLSCTIAALLPIAPVTTAEAQSVYPGLFSEKMKIQNQAECKSEAVPLSSVRLLPSRVRENMERDSAWMMSLDANRLVHSFQTTAGVWAGKEGGYMTVKKLGGWESLDCELRGHAVGHLMSALSLMYAATGEKCFKSKGDSIVAALKEVQEENGNGYLSAWPEGLIHRNMQGKGVWAPWYTLHKILAGLIDQYLYASNDDALTVATGMGDWAYNKLHALSDSTRRLMIRNEFGGFPEAMYNLYAITGNDEYKQVAKFFYHNDVIDPLKQRKEYFGTKHTNTFIPKVLAEARLYEISKDAGSRTASEFFYERMMKGHTFVTGCSSDKEHFLNPKDFTKHLSGYTGETCCTYNMLKLARHLFSWTADESFMEYYERALFNQILGQQDPQTGMVHYFQPMLSGAYKLYSTPENSFWCCVGSGFENHAKYGEMIYSRNTADKGIMVNLFIPSKLTLDGVSIRQETAFPNSSQTTIDVKAAKATTVYLRYPEWCKKASVKVNGKSVSVKQQPGSYIPVAVKGNAKIIADFPMSITAENANGDDSRVALLKGPIVLAGELGAVENPFSDPKKYNDYYTFDFQVPDGLPVSLDIDLKNPGKSLLPTANPMVFKTKTGVTVSPLYDIHHQRYVVYWQR